jgi:site-specific recombinase XerD
MSQHTNVVLSEISYTRADYTAIRAYVQRVPIHIIADRYYSEESPQLKNGLERFLIDMRDDLVERAVEHNPHFSEVLKGARQGGNMTVKALEILIKAADAPKAIPQLADPISMWFRPKTVVALRHENIRTISDLVHIIQRRGANWWRPIPRVGQLRAKVIVSWLSKHSSTLGQVTVDEPIFSSVVELTLDPNRPSQLVPIERILLPTEFSGRFGINRSPHFCYIQADNDKDALLSYLYRFTDQPHTFRCYRKELERFLLWSVMVQKKPMSSLFVDDCEAYKAFLREPIYTFTGPKVARTSSRWKPFIEETMSAKSQKQALLIIRACFKYLVDVRYLAGNPWVVVKDPSVTEEINSIQIERALSEDLWEKVITHLESKTKLKSNSQVRIALAAILLMGDSGLRRHEVAGATRGNLKLYDAEHKIFTLKVHGKGNKNRLVPVSERTVNAIKAHWKDRNLNFDALNDSTPLLGPLVIPRHEAAINKHESNKISGYSADALYPLVMQTWRNIKNIDGLEETFTLDDIDKLINSSPHAFRHTFGTLAVEAEMPLDVVQHILGHASSTTTGIYVKTKEKRMVTAATKFFNKVRNDE